MRKLLLEFGSFLLLILFIIHFQIPQVSSTVGTIVQSKQAFKDGVWRGLSGNLALVNYYPHHVGKYTVYVPKVYHKTLAPYAPHHHHHHHGVGLGLGISKTLQHHIHGHGVGVGVGLQKTLQNHLYGHGAGVGVGIHKNLHHHHGHGGVGVGVGIQKNLNHHHGVGIGGYGVPRPIHHHPLPVPHHPPHHDIGVGYGVPKAVHHNEQFHHQQTSYHNHH